MGKCDKNLFRNLGLIPGLDHEGVRHDDASRNYWSAILRMAVLCVTATTVICPLNRASVSINLSSVSASRFNVASSRINALGLRSRTRTSESHKGQTTW